MSIVYTIIFSIVVAIAYVFYKQYQEKQVFDEYAKKYDLTIDELKQYDGVKMKRTFVAVNGDIFDVSSSAFYTPGGSYRIFAGHDASVSLAKGDLEGKYLDDPPKDLQQEEQASLNEWHNKFSEKYRKVGKLINQ